MIKALEAAISKVRRLPEDRQRLAAAVLEDLAAQEPYLELSQDERDAIKEGLAQADRGEFASDEDVEALLRRPWR